MTYPFHVRYGLARFLISAAEGRRLMAAMVAAPAAIAVVAFLASAPGRTR